MKILSIKFKNVQSYGSDEQYIKFEDTGIFSIITGKNGNGKSSICNAIKYAIYGKIDGYTNAEFCNRENKSVWTKIELISKNKNIIIERGLKPDIFKLIIDGIEYDKAGKRELQEYIDNEILDISYDIFKNVFVLSVNDFKSFITMSPNDKRNIIDKIFGYDILNVIRNKVKNTRKNLKNDLKILEEELKFIDSSTNSIQEKIDKIKNSDIEDITNKQIELKNELAVLVEKRDKLTHIKNDFLNKESDIIKKQDSIKNDYYNISSEIKTLTKSIELFKSERCPTCASVFENKKEQLIELQQKYDSYVNDLKNNVEEKNHHLHIHKNIKDNILKVDNKYTEIIKSIYVLTQQYQNITSKLESNNATKDLLDLLNENIKKREQLLYDKQFSYNEDEYHNMLEIIIGDDGIKKLTLNNMIPFFNSTILSLSEQLHLPYTITFDNKFDCIIKYRGVEVSPKTLSTGERKKSDFIIIISLIKLLKKRFPSLNLIFLDEIFSSIDQESIYEILKILGSVTKELQLNCFVINHTILPSELFDQILNIKKDNGFSTIVLEKII